MSDINKYIFAIGGGGFTHRKDKSLDNFILSIKNKMKLELIVFQKIYNFKCQI